MTLRLPRWLRCTSGIALFSAVPVFVFLFLILLMTAPRSLAEPLPLERAIRLALAHSTSCAIAGADVQRTFASYRELRNNYVPQIVAGSGLGWTYGYPLSIEGSPPALFDVVAQNTVFNPAQCHHPGRRPDLRRVGKMGGAARALAAGRRPGAANGTGGDRARAGRRR